MRDSVPKRPSFVRPLYPQATRDRDCLRVLVGLARHVRAKGYWPNAKELTAFLVGCDRGALVDCLHHLLDQRLVAHTPAKAGAASYQLMPTGWALLGLKPIEPWGKRASRALFRKAVRETARRIMRQEVAERAQSVL